MIKIGNTLISTGIVLLMIFGSAREINAASLSGLTVCLICLAAGKILGGGAEE